MIKFKDVALTNNEPNIGSLWLNPQSKLMKYYNGGKWNTLSADVEIPEVDLSQYAKLSNGKLNPDWMPFAYMNHDWSEYASAAGSSVYANFDIAMDPIVVSSSTQYRVVPIQTKFYRSPRGLLGLGLRIHSFAGDRNINPNSQNIVLERGLAAYTNSMLGNYATTNQVDQRIKSIVGAAPEALDTLEEIAARLGEDSDAITAINGVLEGKVSSIDFDAYKTEAEGKFATVDDNGKLATNLPVNHHPVKADVSTAYADPLVYWFKKTDNVYDCNIELGVYDGTEALSSTSKKLVQEKALTQFAKVNSEGYLQSPISISHNGDDITHNENSSSDVPITAYLDNVEDGLRLNMSINTYFGNTPPSDDSMSLVQEAALTHYATLKSDGKLDLTQLDIEPEYVITSDTEYCVDGDPISGQAEVQSNALYNSLYLKLFDGVERELDSEALNLVQEKGLYSVLQNYPKLTNGKINATQLNLCDSWVVHEYFSTYVPVNAPLTGHLESQYNVLNNTVHMYYFTGNREIVEDSKYIVQERGLYKELQKYPKLENGLIPSSYLPSYVDDVLEYDTLSAFPEEGESGKIYVDITENKTYRWSGNQYIEISKSLALGETSSTAYAGDKGAANAAAISNIQTTLSSLDSNYAKLTDGKINGSVIPLRNNEEVIIGETASTSNPLAHHASVSEDGTLSIKPSMNVYDGSREVSNTSGNLVQEKALINYISTSKIGVANGVAGLDEDGKLGNVLPLYDTDSNPISFVFDPEPVTNNNNDVNALSIGLSYADSMGYLVSGYVYVYDGTNPPDSSSDSFVTEKALTNFIMEEQKGKGSGVVPLGTDLKIDPVYLPDSVVKTGDNGKIPFSSIDGSSIEITGEEWAASDPPYTDAEASDKIISEYIPGRVSIKTLTNYNMSYAFTDSASTFAKTTLVTAEALRVMAGWYDRPLKVGVTIQEANFNPQGAYGRVEDFVEDIEILKSAPYLSFEFSTKNNIAFIVNCSPYSIIIDNSTASGGVTGRVFKSPKIEDSVTNTTYVLTVTVTVNASGSGLIYAFKKEAV